METHKEVNAVLYTDGSYKYRDQTYTDGYWGSGAHAYIYDDESVGKQSGDRPKGYAITPEGYVILEEFNKDTMSTVIPLHYIDMAFSYLNSGNSYLAELHGLCNAVNMLYNVVLSDTDEEYKIKKMVIYIDNQSLVDHWVSININPDLLQEDIRKELLQLKETIKLKGTEVIVRKVKAHATSLGNNTADLLAKYARIESRNRNIFNKGILSRGKYWSDEESPHPLLNFRQLFFTNNLRAKNQEIIYSIMDYPANTEVGKKSSDVLFGMVILSEPPMIIEEAIKKYHRLANSLSMISTLNLNTLFSRDNRHYYNTFGPDVYSFYPKAMCMQDLANNSIIAPVQPSGLANQTMEKMAFLYELINSYRSYKDSLETIESFIDVTDKIYEVTVGKKSTKYKCILDVGVGELRFDVDVKGKKEPIPLVLGVDTLSRNQFKQLEKESPKVYLVISPRGDKSFMYYTIIETENGDIGIYYNMYTCLKVGKKESK